jgi:hypothetical protein
MSLPKQLEARPNADAAAREEFYTDPIAVLGRAGILLQPDSENALRGLQVKTHLKAGPQSLGSRGIVIEYS